MSQPQSSRFGVVILLFISLVGFAIALYAYFTPLTGVTGSLGALIVVLACIALGIMALILLVAKSRGARNTLRVMTLMGLVGTGFAGILLHQWGIGVAMAVGLFGLILDMARPVHRRAHP